jgi:hypothetical protein
MTSLPSFLKHSGYDLTLVERGAFWAIYRKSKDGYHNPHFEVVVIEVRPAETMPTGSELPEREVYPNSEAWGQLGWTCNTLKRARAIASLIGTGNTGEDIRNALPGLRKTCPDAVS